MGLSGIIKKVEKRREPCKAYLDLLFLLAKGVTVKEQPHQVHKINCKSESLKKYIKHQGHTSKCRVERMIFLIGVSNLC